MPQCYLGLGGNVGDVARTFADALDALTGDDGVVRVVRTSSLYRTRPVGAESGGEFLNAAAEVETDLPPPALLKRTQQVESVCGRTRDVHWGPRPLDLDLLLYGDQIIDEPALTVPHPALWYRRFVLDPLAEIAADVTHPVRRATILQLRQRLLTRPFRLVIASDDVQRRKRLLVELHRRFPEVQLESTVAERPDNQSIPSTMARLNPPEEDFVRGPVVDGLNRSWLNVPDDGDGGLEFLSDVIAAATDEPLLVAPSIEPDR